MRELSLAKISAFRDILPKFLSTQTSNPRLQETATPVWMTEHQAEIDSYSCFVAADTSFPPRLNELQHE
jgi:hypothetical protein